MIWGLLKAWKEKDILDWAQTRDKSSKRNEPREEMHKNAELRYVNQEIISAKLINLTRKSHEETSHPETPLNNLILYVLFKHGCKDIESQYWS